MAEIKQKKDPHNHQKLYQKWKDEGKIIDGIHKNNRNLIIQYLDDMEVGKNIAIGSKKGSRSPGRLRNQKGKLHAICKLLETEFKINLSELDEDTILTFFSNMRKGMYKSARTNKVYTAPGTYVKAFKSFWHWYIKYSWKTKKIEINDITTDLDSRDDKPKFNYITMEQFKVLFDNAKYYYKVFMMFLFDTGIRAPTECMNVKVSDLKWDSKEKRYHLDIREETSKTFGRKIKLMLCSDILKEYIKREKLKSNDYLFTRTPQKANQYIARLANKLLGLGTAVRKKSKDGSERLVWVSKGLTMYDFRHSSACYWLPRYKSESALKYRFGWKRSAMIHYYTEFLGMKDTIQDEDLYIDISKTELEKQIDREKKERELLEERMSAKEKEMDDMKRTIELLTKSVKINQYVESNQS